MCPTITVAMTTGEEGSAPIIMKAVSLSEGALRPLVSARRNT